MNAPAPFHGETSSGAEVSSSSSESDGDAISSSGALKAMGKWTADEHDRFLRAMEQFPIGPWSAIADVVHTRSVRQVHSHAQKYAAKVERHKRGHAKVRRNRITGEHGEPSGHRVVAQIPGKFTSDVAASERRQRDKESDKSLLEASTTRHQAEAIGAASMKETNTAPRPQTSSHHDDHHTTATTPQVPDRSPRPQPTLPLPRRTNCHPDGRQMTITNPRPTDRSSRCQLSLPSLDESLDFFIRHFTDS